MAMNCSRSSSLEVGKSAVWSVSSCKPGFGVAQLRDDSTETFWQSDGPQPHLVNIEFRRNTSIQKLQVYVDYKLDESYTPSRIAVRAGTNHHDLTQVSVVELNEPEGWVDIDTWDKQGRAVKGFLFQVVVRANHQNGKDTHLRQIKIFSPRLLGDSSAPSVPFQTAEYLSMLRI